MMKKFAAVLVVVMMAAGVFAFSACSGALESPADLRVNGNLVTWTGESARFVVTIKEDCEEITRSTVSLTQYDLGQARLEIGNTYTISVISRATGSRDSVPESRTFVYEGQVKLGTPVNIRIDENTVTWDAVNYAEEYDVTITNAAGAVVAAGVVLTPEFDVSEDGLNFGSRYFVHVLARATGHTDSNEGMRSFVYSYLPFVIVNPITSGELFDALNSAYEATMFMELNITSLATTNITHAYQAIVGGERGVIIIQSNAPAWRESNNRIWGSTIMLLALDNDSVIVGAAYFGYDPSTSNTSQAFWAHPLVGERGESNFAAYLIGNKWNEINVLPNDVLPNESEHKEAAAGATFTFISMQVAARNAAQFHDNNRAALMAAPECLG
jgi:hypothetical protein